MSLKNLLIRTALKLCPVPAHSKVEPRRFLVVATTALGDTLWATPALQSLRESFPDAYIAVLTSPIGEEVLKHNPWTNTIFPLTRPLTLWKTLLRERLDTVLLFHASQRWVLPLCAKIGASQIVGTSGINKGLDALLTHPLPNDYQHEIIRRLKMVETIGGKTKTETLSFFLQKEERVPLRSKKTWIAIHPGSRDGFKRWPPHHFAAVGRRLQELIPCEILVTGTRGERSLMESVAREIPGAHLGDVEMPLRPFASILEQVDLLISNDTGVVHLAYALGRPVVVLFSSTDPHFYGPHKAANATVLYKKRTCEPCLKRRCRRPFCLLQIGVSEVVDAALARLERTCL